MKIIKIIQTLIQTLNRKCAFLLRSGEKVPAGRMRCAAAGVRINSKCGTHLDELTDDGLLLREAVPVRSAEFWLQMGYPELALEELQTLPESARRHPWTRRVSFDATVAKLHQTMA
ncbi:MAG: hypothetical protein WCH99_19530 [Verrucomicrobiota bacterium]